MMTPAQRQLLETTRALLDNLDDALIDLLVQRAEVVDDLWRWKQSQALEVRDPAREAEVLERLVTRAVAKGLDEQAVRAVLATVIGRRLRAS
ncbi:MAG: chorismate mutase [Myxococcaceae bacterium]|nr:chorismate mutase [Myxococcaceae bacterium]